MARSKDKIVNTIDLTDKINNISQYYEETTYAPGESPFTQNKKSQLVSALKEIKETADIPIEYEDGLKGLLGVEKKNAFREAYGSTATYGEALRASWTKIKDSTLITEVIRTISDDPTGLIGIAGVGAKPLWATTLPKEKALTREEWENDPDLYREDIIFDESKGLSYRQLKAQAERRDERKFADEIYSELNGGQKALTLLSELAGNLVVDLPFNAATGALAAKAGFLIAGKVLNGSTTSKLLTTTFLAGFENVVQNEILDLATEERLIREGGRELTPEEKRLGMLISFGFGAGIGAIAGGFKIRSENKALNKIEEQIVQKPSSVDVGDAMNQSVYTTEKTNAFLSGDDEVVATVRKAPMLSNHVKDANGDIRVLPTEFTVDGKQYNVSYKIVEMEDLFDSKNKDYPQDLKLKTKAVEEDLNFSPDNYLLSNELNSGSLLTTSDNMVVDGNLRLAILRNLYNSENPQSVAYKQRLNDLMPEMGVMEMKRPILTRELNNALSLDEITKLKKGISPEFQDSKINKVISNAFSKTTKKHTEINNKFRNGVYKEAGMHEQVLAIAENINSLKDYGDPEFSKFLEKTATDVIPYLEHLQNLKKMEGSIDDYLRQSNIITDETEGLIRAFYKNMEEPNELLSPEQINNLFKRYREIEASSTSETLLQPDKVFYQARKEFESYSYTPNNTLQTPLSSYKRNKFSFEDLPKYYDENIAQSKNFETLDKIIEESLVDDKFKTEFKNFKEQSKVRKKQFDDVINCLLS